MLLYPLQRLPLVLAERHGAGNQQFEVFGIHRRSSA
jgi:hypothetical protein